MHVIRTKQMICIDQFLLLKIATRSSHSRGLTWRSIPTPEHTKHCAKRHIFATDFARIRIRTRGVNDNILKYARTHDATYTSNILLRIRTVFPNSNRIPWNTLKHSKRHTPTPFLKKTNIDQLQTMMISSHWNILV